MCDPNNCGGCGVVCTSDIGTPVCVNGQCSTSCPSGLTSCDNTCVDLQVDSANCGTCGDVCPSDGLTAACGSGKCFTSSGCPAGETPCSTPAYWQMGAVATNMPFVNSGVSTDLIVNSDQLSDGGCHFYWVATGVEAPTQTIFLQMGYSWCGSGTPTPFVYSLGSTIPGSTGFLYNTAAPYALAEGTWYTFTMSSDGVEQSDGTYVWNFYVQPRGGSQTLLVSVPFESAVCNYPYVVSEIAGSTDACADSVDVTYSELRELNGGTWQESPHGTAYYGYGPCPNSDVVPLGAHHFETLLRPGETMTNPFGTLLW